MKLTSMIAAFALMTAAAAAPVSPASAERTNPKGALSETHGFCTWLVGSGIYPTLNYGECIGYNVSSWEGFVTKECDRLLENDLLESEGFTSYSDCVRNLTF